MHHRQESEVELKDKDAGGISVMQNNTALGFDIEKAANETDNGADKKKAMDGNIETMWVMKWGSKYLVLLIVELNDFDFCQLISKIIQI